MNNKKKELIILGIVTLVLLVTLGVTYAIFTFSKTSVKSELIAGDIYMQYKETKELSVENAMPSENEIAGKYFEFKIKGKNTTTNKDIWYEIVLNRGNIPTGKEESNRIQDKFLKFKLVEVENNVEGDNLLTASSYNDIRNKRIYVATIPKNTTSEIEHTYRLYMWISNSVGIGTDTDYTISEWNNLFASVKVNVTGDFEEKEISVEPTDASCFVTSVLSEENKTISITKYKFKDIQNVVLNSEISEESKSQCMTYFSENYLPFISDTEKFCSGESDQNMNLIPKKDLVFFLENGTISADIVNEDCGSDVVIPKKIDGKLVTKISDEAFYGNVSNLDFLTSVVIPNSVTTIGNYAFRGNKLTSLVIPNSVTTIGGYAFHSNQLTSVVIPNSVTTIESYAFEKNQLTSVVIPNSVTTIGYGAFASNQLTSVVIPDSVTAIGGYAFQNNQLTSVILGNSVTTIGEAAFNFNKLTSVEIPDSVTTIDWEAFKRNNIVSVIVPDSVIESPWYGDDEDLCSYFDAETEVTWKNITKICWNENWD